MPTAPFSPRRFLVPHALAAALLLALPSCGIEPLDECTDDSRCRYGRVCIDGACSWPGGGASGSGGARSGDSSTPAPGEFCEGAPKAEVGGLLVAPVPVTAAHHPTRDCCDDIAVRFHTTPELGYDVRVNIGWMAVAVPGGPIDVDGPPDGLDLWICHGPEATCEIADLTGTISVDSINDEGALSVDICIDVSQPGGELDGARLFVEDAFIAPWHTSDRFGLHLLADQRLTAEAVLDRPLHTLLLSDLSLLDLSSLFYYDVRTYEMGYNAMLRGRLQDSVADVPVGGLPFMVVVDHQPIFVGAFYTEFSSYCPPLPLITVERMGDYSFTLETGCIPEGGVDTRTDERLLEMLRETGRLAE